VHSNDSTVLFDYFFADGQPEPRAARVSRETGFEHFFDLLRLYADALILKIDLYLPLACRRDKTYTHREQAARRHGAERIERQVQENLLQPVRICLDQDFFG
jgi:hypothetical protein